jgi:hypothetical protein
VISTPGATPYAEEDDGASAYAADGKRRSKSERDAYGMITKAAPRNDLFDPRWSVWQPVSADRKPPTAMSRWDRTIPPAVLAASP